MPNRVVLYPYKMNSQSAIVLQESLIDQGIRCKRVRPDGNYNPKRNDLIINWGNGHTPHWFILNILNHPVEVDLAINKLDTFEVLKQTEISIPEYTTDPDIAAEWFDDNHIIVGRRTLTGHSGQGIELMCSSLDEGFRDFSSTFLLYVKYVKKTAEYRVHVWKGEIIDVQQKRKRRGVEVNTQIRTHGNGWVFCHEEVAPPQMVLDEAKKSVTALGLDFGAVDAIWNNHYNKAYVLEVNTAPGLEGVTLTKYVNKIKELL